MRKSCFYIIHLDSSLV